MTPLKPCAPSCVALLGVRPNVEGLRFDWCNAVRELHGGNRLELVLDRLNGRRASTRVHLKVANADRRSAERLNNHASRRWPSVNQLDPQTREYYRGRRDALNDELNCRHETLKPLMLLRPRVPLVDTISVDPLRIKQSVDRLGEDPVRPTPTRNALHADPDRAGASSIAPRTWSTPQLMPPDT